MHHVEYTITFKDFITGNLIDLHYNITGHRPNIGETVKFGVGPSYKVTGIITRYGSEPKKRFFRKIFTVNIFVYLERINVGHTTSRSLDGG